MGVLFYSVGGDTYQTDSLPFDTDVDSGYTLIFEKHIFLI